MHEKEKTPAIVQDLCKKLKEQMEQLNAIPEKEVPKEEIQARKDLFRALQDQLASLSR